MLSCVSCLRLYKCSRELWTRTRDGRRISKEAAAWSEDDAEGGLPGSEAGGIGRRYGLPSCTGKRVVYGQRTDREETKASWAQNFPTDFWGVSRWSPLCGRVCLAVSRARDFECRSPGAGSSHSGQLDNLEG